MTPCCIENVTVYIVWKPSNRWMHFYSSILYTKTSARKKVLHSVFEGRESYNDVIEMYCPATHFLCFWVLILETRVCRKYQPYQLIYWLCSNYVDVYLNIHVCKIEFIILQRNEELLCYESVQTRCIHQNGAS